VLRILFNWVLLALFLIVLVNVPLHYSQISHTTWFSWLVFGAFVWAIWFYFKSRKGEKEYTRHIASAIQEVSNVNEGSCIEICRTTAVALNYAEQAVYIINGDCIKKLRFGQDILSWEFIPFENSSAQRLSGVMAGTQLVTRPGQSETMDLASGGAMASAAAFALIGDALGKMPGQGVLEFSVNDATVPSVWVYIENLNYLKRLQHFFDYCNHTRHR